MKTYLVDIIPKLKRFSQRLDNITLLTDQHWIVIDDIASSKNVYIFKTNNVLLISKNGIVEKAKWEYLGNNSLLIEAKDEIYLFKCDFVDENILALKVDGRDEYALLINENNYDGELNSVDKVLDFLSKKYIEPNVRESNIGTTRYQITKAAKTNIEQKITWLNTDKGKLEIRTKLDAGYTYGDLVFLNGKPAPDGKYVYGWPAWISYVVVKDGKLKNI